MKKIKSTIIIALIISLLLCSFGGWQYLGFLFLLPISFNFDKKIKKIEPFFYLLIGILIINTCPEMPQIWFWHLWLMLVLVSIKKFVAPDDERNQLSNYKIIQIALIGCYFWGGFNKLNPWFATYEFPLLFPFFKENTSLAYGVGIFEMAIAILLIFKKSTTYAFYVALFFHSFIIFHLIKSGWNSVVLPWNICLPLLIFYLKKYLNSYLNPAPVSFQ